MAGAILRIPSFRFLLALIAFLTTIHYFLSYTSPTYVDRTTFPVSSNQDKSDRVVSEEEKFAYREDSDDSIPLPKGWSRGVAPPTEEEEAERAASDRILGDDTVKGKRANAVFVILVRNQEVWDIVDSIRGMEDRFNRKYHYPYVFLNDVPFSEEFKKYTTGIASGPCTYGLVPASHWSEVPDWIDQDKAKAAREQMTKDNVMYGDSVSYRAMCRYQSGFFWRHPLLDTYEYYWRIEPHVKYFCDMDYDPFLYMADRKLKYGFVVSLYEYENTIPTLWKTTKKFMEKYPQHLASPNQLAWLLNESGEDYNHCHFWSNFEIASLDFFRSEAYRDFFDFLDRAGGFHYERWGDAPVHSIAAALFLRPDQMHFFQDVGYRHEPFQNCPQNKPDTCACDPHNSFEFDGYSCTAKWKEVVKYVDGT